MILYQKITGKISQHFMAPEIFRAQNPILIFSLSEMVVHIENINEIITAYIEHEFQERT